MKTLQRGEVSVIKKSECFFFSYGPYGCFVQKRIYDKHKQSIYKNNLAFQLKIQI